MRLDLTIPNRAYKLSTTYSHRTGETQGKAEAALIGYPLLGFEELGAAVLSSAPFIQDTTCKDGIFSEGFLQHEHQKGNYYL